MSEHERERQINAEPLYHTGDQYASALLPPIARSLQTLVKRLDHYHSRLRMADGDRELVEMAQRILTIAQQDLADLLTGDDGQSGAVE